MNYCTLSFDKTISTCDWYDFVIFVQQHSIKKEITKAEIKGYPKLTISQKK